MSLGWKLTARVVAALVVFGTLLFLPAGTFRFWQAWAYLTVWAIPGMLAFRYFWKHDRAFVERRVRSREGVREQKRIMGLLYPIYMAAFLIPGFDHRFGWSHVPLWLTVASLGIVLGTNLMIIWVMFTNRFAARTVQVEAGQQLVSSGPYGVVRHPMYAAICVMLLFVPLALGSYMAMPLFVLIIPLVILRLLNEEKVLCQDLQGYTEYCQRTRFRLVPLVW